MRYKQYILLFGIVFISISVYIHAEEKISNEVLSEKRVRLTWAEVEDAVKYRVLIKDIQEKILIDQETGSNYIIVQLIPGDYKIRIGSINKFGRIDNWSEWGDVIIERPKPKPVEEIKKLAEKKSSNVFKIGFGISYFYILSDWKDYYNNTYNGYSFEASYAGFSGFLKYMGFGLDGTYVKLNNKGTLNSIDSNLTDIICGANIFISTHFDFPLNFALKGGGGLVYTMQEFQKFNSAGVMVDEGKANTTDFYYKAGISIEYTFFSRFFLEASADYYNIMYMVKGFSSLRFSCMAGIKF